MFKQAGYDALIVEGQASALVYLWVSDEGVELLDAVLCRVGYLICKRIVTLTREEALLHGYTQD